MKKILFFLFFSAVSAFASDLTVSVGVASPSRGILGVEYGIVKNELNAGIQFKNFNSSYTEQGMSLLYFPMANSFIYLFHASSWIHGKFDYDGSRNAKGQITTETKTRNYWRVVFGAGIQKAFFRHLGAYAEFGWEFYAGNGGYYLNLERDSGRLDNESIAFPIGFGLIIPFF